MAQNHLKCPSGHFFDLRNFKPFPMPCQHITCLHCFQQKYNGKCAKCQQAYPQNYQPEIDQLVIQQLEHRNVYCEYHDEEIAEYFDIRSGKAYCSECRGEKRLGEDDRLIYVDAKALAQHILQQSQILTGLNEADTRSIRELEADIPLKKIINKYRMLLKRAKTSRIQGVIFQMRMGQYQQDQKELSDLQCEVCYNYFDVVDFKPIKHPNNQVNCNFAICRECFQRSTQNSVVYTCLSCRSMFNVNQIKEQNEANIRDILLKIERYRAIACHKHNDRPASYLLRNSGMQVCNECALEYRASQQEQIRCIGVDDFKNHFLNYKNDFINLSDKIDALNSNSSIREIISIYQQIVQSGIQSGFDYSLPIIPDENVQYEIVSYPYCQIKCYQAQIEVLNYLVDVEMFCCNICVNLNGVKLVFKKTYDNDIAPSVREQINLMVQACNKLHIVPQNVNEQLNQMDRLTLQDLANLYRKFQLALDWRMVCTFCQENEAIYASFTEQIII